MWRRLASKNLTLIFIKNNLITAVNTTIYTVLEKLSDIYDRIAFVITVSPLENLLMFS